MHACNAAARRNARAKKILLAAIGIAGCTGGPKLTSATNEAPSALVQPSETTQQAKSQSSRAYLAGVASSGSQSIWGRNTASSPPMPRDPFLGSRSGGFQPAPATQTASTRAVASRSHRSQQGLVQPVGFEESNAYCGTPAGVTIQPRQEAPGVVHIKDNRLPPAKPLGASNPFDQDTATAKPRIQATPTNRLAAKPATNKSVQIKPVDRKAATTVPVQKYLATRVTTGGATASTVQNEDMIVDTAILPKRRDWRAATLPPTSQASEQFVISARQPFTTPEWDDSKPNSASSANLPIEISPAAAFDRPNTAIEFAKRAESRAIRDLTPPATVPDPFELPAEPFAAADVTEATVVAPDIAEAPVFDDNASNESLTVAEAPMLAPGSVVSTAPESTGASKMVAGPAMAPAPPEDVEPPAAVAETSSTVANAEPVQLDQANDSAAQEAVRDQSTLGTPAVIGIALAIVAFGAVVIRRRFA